MLGGMTSEPRPDDEGGDAACWLDRVCPDCGAFVERDQPHDCPEPG
jgi:hypothetical protein